MLKEQLEIQEQINRLHAERSKYVAEQTRNRSATNTLDSVVVTTVREQAQKRNYRFE